MKEKTARDLVVTIAIILVSLTFIISFKIIIYSFYTGTLIWGITAAVMIMILTPVLSGFISLIKFLLVDENETS